MKILKWVLIIAVVLAVLVFALLAYMGMVFPLKVYESKMGPYTIAYESFTGPYAQTGPAFDKVHQALKAEGIEAVRGLGIYYDDPAKVAAEKLRSDCGIVIEEKEMAKFNRVRRKFKIKLIRQKECLVVEFPIRNVLSYMLGPIRAYPALTKYAEEKGYKFGMAYELYDEPQKKIFFVMEIAR